MQFRGRWPARAGRLGPCLHKQRSPRIGPNSPCRSPANRTRRASSRTTSISIRAPALETTIAGRQPTTSTAASISACFRLRPQSRRSRYLPPADGTVKGMRDGVADIFFKKAKPQDVAGRECGNGVIIDHGGGWETQYCHMKQGSVHVAKGQTVKRGDQLGEVGFSGMADFAHVHLTVRHDGKVVDPFLPDSVGGACLREASGPGLWEPAAAAAFPYKNGELIDCRFRRRAARRQRARDRPPKCRPAYADGGHAATLRPFPKSR